MNELLLLTLIIMKKRENKSPAFQFYPKDFLSDQNVICMSNEQVGAYMKLLCFAWIDDDCSLPADSTKLEAMTNLGSTTLQPVINCFFEKDGKLFHKRLLKERQKQDKWREKSRKGGLASAKSRAKGGSRVVQPKANSTSTSASTNTTPTPSEKGGEEKEKKEIMKTLTKWFSEMDDVSKPAGLAKFFVDKYSIAVIKKTLRVGHPTSRKQFSDFCEFYTKEMNIKKPKNKGSNGPGP